MAKQAPHYSQIFSQSEINYLKNLAALYKNESRTILDDFLTVHPQLIDYLKYVQQTDGFIENLLKKKIKYRDNFQHFYIKPLNIPSQGSFNREEVDISIAEVAKINPADFNSVDVNDLMSVITVKVAFIYYLIFKKQFNKKLLNKKSELINIYKIESQFLKTNTLPAHNLIKKYKDIKNKDLKKKLSFNRSRAALVLFVAYTWHKFLKRLSFKRQIELLCDLKIITAKDALEPEHIKKIISRLGFKKSGSTKSKKST